ncbi:LysE/ArgO family amino acid transporter [Nereida sp. MMG025]|uniref:LysE/ArgO family amino acid transporter n=1 Tax=Nereida sp. MMG025 TaxID=2909981 RepID=UPI001F48E2C5|nr:LysE/ArgO family amino acid transporter [Nereida sp. MMG025]MCF6443930.1 LysE/ArgO family amino acid transporter [Nereida sp. MMG025]
MTFLESSTFAAGFLLSISLILAIGAQNAFVLRQGLRREHVLALVLFCAACDALLITLGVLGFGAISKAAPWITPAFTYGGAAFLFVYGLRSFMAARKGGAALMPSENASISLTKALLTCAAITFLNPHVYLDTVVLIGSISANYDNKLAFAIGASFASFSFFFALGYGAQLLRPFFANPRSWQILEIIVGAFMWSIALKLLLS